LQPYNHEVDESIAEKWGKAIIDSLKSLNEAKKTKKGIPESLRPQLSFVLSRKLYLVVEKTKASPKSKEPKFSNDNYVENLKRLTVKEDDVAKLTESRITATWLHPSAEKLLCAAGDKDGHLGLWEVNAHIDMSLLHLWYMK
jgi:hypothetical protein